MATYIYEMRIALFGGSFNPPHKSHVAVVKHLIESKNFDEVWIIPCLAHAFGKKLAPYSDRVTMCRLAFEAIDPQVRVQKTDEEIQNTQGWSILTLRHLHQKHPEYEFHWVMGSDLIQEKKRWKNFDEIEKLAKIHPIPRAGYESSSFAQLSSSQIREKISKSEALAGIVSPEVEEYIQVKGLYQ